MVAEADFKPLYSVTRAKAILNLNFIPAQQSMLDMAEYFLANNLVSSAGDTAKEANFDGHSTPIPMQCSRWYR